MSPSIEVIPVEGLPEVHEGQHLGRLLAPKLKELGLRSGDVVCVTQKIVSKAEGRVFPAATASERESWVGQEARRVVAQRGDLVIAETRHGFVCANAGVDGSNVPEGFVSLLPEDPDESAMKLHRQLITEAMASVGVVITDTFGRAWRRGLVNVAIGCAGLPALLDLRGTTDAGGRELEATVVALADEIAAAAGLVMGKADGVPAAIVRGARKSGKAMPASELVRPPDEDLFRESPLLSIGARRSIRSFGPGGVPGEAVRAAVQAACTAPAPHHTRPWLFVALDSGPARRRLLGAMAEAWKRDLAHDGTPEDVVRRRLDSSDALLGAAPMLIVPAVRMLGSHRYPDEKRALAEEEMFLLSAGAGIQNLLLALHAQRLASCWVSSTLFCKDETLQALGLDDEWIPLGAVAVGRPPVTGQTPGRPNLDLGEHLRFDEDLGPPRTRPAPEAAAERLVQAVVHPVWEVQPDREHHTAESALSDLAELASAADLDAGESGEQGGLGDEGNEEEDTKYE